MPRFPSFRLSGTLRIHEPRNLKFWTYPQWKQATGLGSHVADALDTGEQWVSESSYQSADGVDVEPGDFFYACIELENLFGRDFHVASLHFLSKESNEDYPLVAFEKLYPWPYCLQKFRTRTDAEQYLKLLVESGGVKTTAIKAVAEKEGVAVRKALRDAEQKAYQQSQETLKEKANSGCVVLVLPLLAWMTWVLWG